MLKHILAIVFVAFVILSFLEMIYYLAPEGPFKAFQHDVLNAKVGEVELFVETDDPDITRGVIWFLSAAFFSVMAYGTEMGFDSILRLIGRRK